MSSKNRTLPIAAAVAAVVAAGWLGATHYVGRTAETRYNAQVDRVLAALPFLKVEERSYQRSLFGADSRLVLRFSVPNPPLAAARGTQDGADGDDEDDEDNDDEDDEDSDVAEVAPTPRAPMPDVRVVFKDHIDHGPFPGSLKPAAARIASVVTAELIPRTVAPATDSAPAAAAASSAALTVLTADTTIDFSDGYASRFNGPAGDWSFEEGRGRLVWSGFEGESSGNFETLASRYTMQSPGLQFKGGKPDGESAEIVVGAIRFEGSNEATKSLLIAPGTMRGTVASMKAVVTKQGAGPSIGFELSDLSTESATSRTGDLLDIRTTSKGKGLFSATRIDGFEMTEHWKRLHAPTLESMVRKVLAVYGQETLPDPQTFVEPILGDLRALLPHDPEYALEKLGLTIDGQTATLAWRAGLTGATAAMADNPMALASAATAAVDIKAPRAWIDSLLALGAAAPLPVSAKDVGGLIAQGEQMGFVKVDGDLISTEVRFTKGRLDVNGRKVFQMPGSR